MPHQAWSDKRERQYEHIKNSARKGGASSKRAKEIAARTVNKERAQAGEAKTTSGTPREEMPSARRGGLRSGGRTGRRAAPREQLYAEARRLNVLGRSSMNKAQLQRAVDRRRS